MTKQALKRATEQKDQTPKSQIKQQDREIKELKAGLQKELANLTDMAAR